MLVIACAVWALLAKVWQAPVEPLAEPCAAVGDAQLRQIVPNAQVKPSGDTSETSTSCLLQVQKHPGEIGSVDVLIGVFRHRDDGSAKDYLEEQCTPPFLDEGQRLLEEFKSGPAGDEMCGFAMRQEGTVGSSKVDVAVLQERDVIDIRYSETGASEGKAKQRAFKLAESVAKAIEE